MYFIDEVEGILQACFLSTMVLLRQYSLKRADILFGDWVEFRSILFVLITENVVVPFVHCASLVLRGLECGYRETRSTSASWTLLPVAGLTVWYSGGSSAVAHRAYRRPCQIYGSELDNCRRKSGDIRGEVAAACMSGSLTVSNRGPRESGKHRRSRSWRSDSRKHLIM
jgi:hypothetical protein